MAPRIRTKNEKLASFPGLGIYLDGRYFYKNPYTGRQRSLKTRDLKQAIARWALAKAICDKEYGDTTGQALAASLQGSNTPISKGDNVHLGNFIQKWRTEILEKDRVMVKIKRSQGKPLAPRTKEDYRKYAVQLESKAEARFPISSPKVLTEIRKLLAQWVSTPTHYNHLKAVLGRVFDHAVISGLIEKNPMRDIDKVAVAERTVLIPDEVYVRITGLLTVHKMNRRVYDGTWRAKFCDLFYMLSQQPVDAFALKLSQIDLTAGKHGEIKLSRAKTSVAGIIEMNAEMRAVVDWLIAYRASQLKKRSNVVVMPGTDHLLLYPAYMDQRSRWKPVMHRTFSGWWAEAVTELGLKGEYWLMDLRKKGLTDEFVSQGENDKGLHETDAMKRHYRLITPPKRSKNTLTAIRERKA